MCSYRTSSYVIYICSRNRTTVTFYMPYVSLIEKSFCNIYKRYQFGISCDDSHTEENFKKEILRGIFLILSPAIRDRNKKNISKYPYIKVKWLSRLRSCFCFITVKLYIDPGKVYNYVWEGYQQKLRLGKVTLQLNFKIKSVMSTYNPLSFPQALWVDI